MDLAAELKRHVSGDEPGDNYQDAVDAFVAAVKKGDKATAAEALKAAICECMAEDEAAMDEPEQSGPSLAIMLAPRRS